MTETRKMNGKKEVPQKGMYIHLLLTVYSKNEDKDGETAVGKGDRWRHAIKEDKKLKRGSKVEIGKRCSREENGRKKQQESEERRKEQEREREDGWSRR